MAVLEGMVRMGAADLKSHDPGQTQAAGQPGAGAVVGRERGGSLSDILYTFLERGDAVLR